MKNMLTRRALPLLACGAVLATAPPAWAASTTDCTNPALVPHPVYIAGASEVAAYLEALAVTVAKDSVALSLIYAAPSACVGLGDIVTSGQTETSPFSFVTATGTLSTCTGAPTDGGFAPYAPEIYVDIGVSGVYPSTCITPPIPTPLPAAFKDFQGPIQPYEIAVPWASSQFSISAEAAYVVFGFGGQTYTVNPWTVSTDIWTRGDTSGAQLIIADAIELSGAKWLTTLGDAGGAQILKNNTVMVSSILGSGATDPNGTIGILGSGTLDPAKGAAGGLKPLAFQGVGQDCGYYADSDLNLFDKINVRQGRYEIWGPEHFVSNVDASGKAIANPSGTNPVPSSAADVQRVLGFITHSGVTVTSTPSLQDVIEAEASAHFVPDCAMQVERTSELGPEASYQPPVGCGCFYEDQPNGGAGALSTYCVTCTVATEKSDCSDPQFPHCNFGYCEAQ